MSMRRVEHCRNGVGSASNPKWWLHITGMGKEEKEGRERGKKIRKLLEKSIELKNCKKSALYWSINSK